MGLSLQKQQYERMALYINLLREELGRWRNSAPSDWHVTPETARLLEHWRKHPFANRRPFFCQL